MRTMIDIRRISLLVVFSGWLYSCDTTGDNPSSPPPISSTFYLGADLSYVNEIETEGCGETRYKDKDGNPKDPFAIFKDAGCDIVRVRLWHNPSWTHYSTLEDVTKTIRRAKQAGMKVLLDFHYSDTWADPSNQRIPAAWAKEIDNTPALVDSIYNYTSQTLKTLHRQGLLPDIVQIGNEITAMIMQPYASPASDPAPLKPMDWTRNASLIRSGIKAVRDIAKETGKTIEVMLHPGGVDVATHWFNDATFVGKITDYDWIGLSYYTIHTSLSLVEVSKIISSLIQHYQKKVMIVETAYAFTLDNNDKQGNNMKDETAAYLDGSYPISQNGQYRYLIDLAKTVKNAGGSGVIYWEPAWIANTCTTLFGEGSSWDNATLFDKDGKPTEAMKFFKEGKK